MVHEKTTLNCGMHSLAKKKDKEMESGKEPGNSDALDDLQLEDVAVKGPELLTLIEEEVAPLQEIVLSTEVRLKTVSAAYVELQGEITGMKERAVRQRRVERELMKGEVVRSLFEPLQNLRRSVEALGEEALDSELASGLDMVLREFVTAFEALGLEEVPGVGAAFDPEIHEALSILPVTEPEQDGKILEVFSTGYRIGSSLLTPAKVIIGKFEEPVGEA